MKTRMSVQLWFILHGMKVKERMKDKLEYYRSMKQAYLKFGLKFK